MTTTDDNNKRDDYVESGLYGIGTFHSLLAVLIHGEMLSTFHRKSPVLGFAMPRTHYQTTPFLH